MNLSPLVKANMAQFMDAIPFWPATAMTGWFENLNEPPDKRYEARLMTIAPDGKHIRIDLVLMESDIEHNTEHLLDLLRNKFESAYLAMKDVIDRQHTPKVPA